jgi:hypothetical protein
MGQPPYVGRNNVRTFLTYVLLLVRVLHRKGGSGVHGVAAGFAPRARIALCLEPFYQIAGD